MVGKCNKFRFFNAVKIINFNIWEVLASLSQISLLCRLACFLSPSLGPNTVLGSGIQKHSAFLFSALSAPLSCMWRFFWHISVSAGAYSWAISLLSEDPSVCFFSSSDQFDVGSIRTRNTDVLNVFSSFQLEDFSHVYVRPPHLGHLRREVLHRVELFLFQVKWSLYLLKNQPKKLNSLLEYAPMTDAGK